MKQMIPDQGKLFYMAAKVINENFDLIKDLMKENNMSIECALAYFMHLGAAYEQQCRETVDGLAGEEPEITEGDFNPSEADQSQSEVNSA